MSVSEDGNAVLSCELCGGDIPVRVGADGKMLGAVECLHCFTAHVLEVDDCFDDDTCSVHRTYYLVMGELI